MTISVPTVDPSGDRAVYKQIADHLRGHIDRGDLRPGTKLPSESELMHEFTASRATVRRALTLLTHEGRVEATRGVGVFVRTPSAPLRIRHDPVARLRRQRREHGMGPMSADAERQDFDHRQEIIDLAEISAGVEVSAYLDLQPDDRVFVRRRRTFARPRTRNERFRPAQLADSYLPLDIAVGRLRERDTGPGGTYARIEEHGHRLTRFEEHLTFRMPRPREQRLLELPTGVPVIDLTRIAYAGERPVECFRGVMAGDKYEFHYRIAAR